MLTQTREEWIERFVDYFAPRASMGRDESCEVAIAAFDAYVDDIYDYMPEEAAEDVLDEWAYSSEPLEEP